MELILDCEGKQMHTVLHPVHFDTTENQMTVCQHSFLQLAEVPEHKEPALPGHTWLGWKEDVLFSFLVLEYRFVSVVAMCTFYELCLALPASFDEIIASVHHQFQGFENPY